VPGPPQQRVKLVSVPQCARARDSTARAPDFEGICRATPAQRGSFEVNASRSVDGALDFRRRSTETVGQRG
jgi:hypothetical protein